MLCKYRRVNGRGTDAAEPPPTPAERRGLVVVVTDRFPKWVYGRGSEPDPRFSLANERTFLAWIRTSLALIAGGVAVHALHLQIPDGIGDVTAIALVALGVLAVVLGWVGWMRNERALRQATQLHGAGSATAMTIVFLLTVVVLALGIFAL